MSEPHVCVHCLLKTDLDSHERKAAIAAFDHAENLRIYQERMQLQWGVVSLLPLKFALGWSSGGPIERIIARVYQWTGDDPQWAWEVNLPRLRVTGFTPEKEASIAECEQTIRQFYSDD